MNPKTPLRLALIGMGAAGNARRRALEAIPGIELAAVVSRRAEFATHSWEEVLSDPSIGAVAISTENANHPASVRRSLLADKHVLCDYPLAFQRAEAESLLALAKNRKKILHVEHIGLLADDHQELKSQILKRGKLTRGEYFFQGGFSDKLKNPAWTGPLPFLAVSRLLQMADLFGDFKSELREFSHNDRGFRLHLHLSFSLGGTLGFTEERISGLPRRRSLQAEMEGGPLAWKAASFSGGLFGRDLVHFHERVLQGLSCHYDEALMLRCLESLEKIKTS